MPILVTFRKPEESPSHLSADALRKYGNGDIFVETGTYMGGTVKLALSLKYRRIHSVELDQALHERALELFKDEPTVKLWLGDSIDRLKDIVATLDGPATFWLDAHASGPIVNGKMRLVGGRSGPTPILDELDIIGAHPCKEHTIFIDDCRLFGTDEWFHVSKDEALKHIQSINPAYKIVYLDGHVANDILCATVKG